MKKEYPLGFPFDIACIQSLGELIFSSLVTFFVGENGNDKSTLLEAIACGLQSPVIGSTDVSHDESLELLRLLASDLKFTRRGPPKVNLFFRAEDSLDFTKKIKGLLEDLFGMEEEFEEDVKGSYGLDLAKGVVRVQAKMLEIKIRQNLDGRSHGESFINFFKERVHPRGLYLLDEPETPLPPIHQLSLTAIIKEEINEGCQFVIATHSPMLMAFPGAKIMSLDKSPIRELKWEEVEHARLMKHIFQNPERYLHHLFEG